MCVRVTNYISVMIMESIIMAFDGFCAWPLQLEQTTI